MAAYQEAGTVILPGKEEFIPGENNEGIDWYLGGVAPKYGDFVLETPADTDYFTPAAYAGTGLAKDPKVRHMKSSPSARPVPIGYVNVYQKQPDGNYTKLPK